MKRTTARTSAKKKTAKKKSAAKSRSAVKSLDLKNAQSVKGGRKAGKEQQDYLIVKMNDIIIT